ncbi:helix-turn-helix transcriptional regulator [Nonomuraea bangladeshensis]|uniref:Helix-turn-helix transcriptional regulator n=1 Tax=Nonomuraea bangladeshensis TaxID=404385 RepID=A0ABV3H4E8_9ACTN
MNQPLHLQLREIRRDIRLYQHQLADQIGVKKAAITCWDSGRKTPFVRHADAYARAVDHRLVVADGDTILGDLIGVLPTLPELRRQRGITQEVVSRSMWTSRKAVISLEGRIRRGDNLLLTTVEGYLAGLGLAARLVPAEQLERAA